MARLYEGLRDRERDVLRYLVETPQALQATNREIGEATGRSRWEAGRAIQVLKACGQISSTVEQRHARTITILV